VKAASRRASVRPGLGGAAAPADADPFPAPGTAFRASAVAPDSAERDAAQRRNEELLHELTTMLESNSAGIAYVRGRVSLRLQRRPAARGFSLARIPGGVSGLDRRRRCG